MKGFQLKMVVPIESANFPSPPGLDVEDTTTEERVEALEGRFRALIHSLNKYAFISSEFAETEISSLSDLTGSLDDIADGSTFKRIDGTDVTSNRIAITSSSVSDVGANADQTSANTSNNTSNVAGITAADVAGWGYGPDTTFIDGGQMYVGSNIVLSSSGFIRSGQTAYDTGTGWWIGDVGGTPKFSIGNASADKFTWDGSNIAMVGTSITAKTGTRTIVLDSSGLRIQNAAQSITYATFAEANIKLVDVTTNGPDIDMECYSASDPDSPRIFMRKSHTNTRDSKVATTNEDDLGEINFYGVDTGSGFALGCKIKCEQVGSAGAVTVGAHLEFHMWDNANGETVITFTDVGAITGATMVASSITSGTMDGARVSGGTFGAVKGSALSALNATQLTTGTVPVAAMPIRMKVGVYSGGGAATQAITGVGFQPTALFIFPVDSENSFIRTSTMASTNSKEIATDSFPNDSIRSLDADGFTVGNGTGSNDNMTRSGTNNFHYLAFKTE